MGVITIREGIDWKIIVAVVLVALFIGWVAGIIPVPFSIEETGVETGTTTTTQPLKGFLDIYVVRTFGNGTKSPLSSATVTLYSLDGEYIAEKTTDSSGRAVFEGRPLATEGDEYYVKVTYGSTTVIKRITVLKDNAYTVQTGTYFAVDVEVWVNPSSVTIYVIHKPATTLSDGDVVTEDNPEFTVMIDNTEDGTGFETYYDPVTKRNLEVYAVVKVERLNGSGSITFDTLTKIYTVSEASIYYGFDVDEASLAEYKNVDGTRHDGIYSFTLGATTSSLSGTGTTVKITITVYKNFDLAYFKDKGYANPEAVQLDSFYFYIKKS